MSSSHNTSSRHWSSNRTHKLVTCYSSFSIIHHDCCPKTPSASDNTISVSILISIVFCSYKKTNQKSQTTNHTNQTKNPTQTISLIANPVGQALRQLIFPDWLKSIQQNKKKSILTCGFKTQGTGICF